MYSQYTKGNEPAGAGQDYKAIIAHLLRNVKILWYRNYMDKLGSVASPDGFALRAVRAEAKRYLDELRQAERTVFSEAHFLRPNLPQELCEFHKAFVLMNGRRHSSIAPNDVAQLLAYGYSCGVRAERKRKRT